MNNYHCLNAELATLGSILVSPAALDEISDYLKPDDFTLSLHKDIFRIAKKLAVEGKQTDFICVAETLAKERCDTSNDTFVSVCEIANSPFAPVNVKHYAEIVKQNSLDRKMINVGTKIISSVKEQKENRYDYAQQCLSEIADEMSSDTPTASDTLKNVITLIDERHAKPGELTGLSSGFTHFDQLTHGLNQGDLIVLAARPSMGKTLLAMNMAEHAAIIQKKTVAVFSLEMSKEQLLERCIASLGKIEANLLRLGNLSNSDFQKLSDVTSKCHNTKLFIDDRASVTVSDIRAKCRRIKRQHELDLVIVDYITLMSADGENETLRISNISRGLKMLARDLNVPVIAISQLNRGVEQRNDKRPYMGDLRQSGAIEQDADLIVFIYRDEVYNKNTSHKGTAEIIIAKNRNGATGTIHLGFNSTFCRFDNITTDFSKPLHKERPWKSFDYS